MNNKIKSLPLLEYYGLHKDKLEFYFGFKKRLVANAYTYDSKGSNFEQFYYQVIILEKLEKYLLRDITFSNLSISAREKLTQLLLVANDIITLTDSLESQLDLKINRKFYLNEDYYRFLNLIELFVLKLISFLDVLSKISSYLIKLKKGKNVPDKYGQQKDYDPSRGFKNAFDVTYQRRLIKNKVINDLHKYRNKFSHETSLKLIPYFRNNKWILTLSEGTKEGLKIKEVVIKAAIELSRFINYFERYYIHFLR